MEFVEVGGTMPRMFPAVVTPAAPRRLSCYWLDELPRGGNTGGGGVVDEGRIRRLGLEDYLGFHRRVFHRGGCAHCGLLNGIVCCRVGRSFSSVTFG